MKSSRAFKIIVNLLILIAWGGAVFFLMKREGLLPTADEPPPFNLRMPAEIEIDSWRSIYVDGRWIGYVHVLYGPGEGGFTSTSLSFLRFALFGQTRELVIESRQLLDGNHRLLEFETVISGIAGITVKGRRTDKGLQATLAYGDVTVEKFLELDDAVFLDRGILQVYRGTDLSPGDTRSLRVLNPMTLQPETVTLRVRGREQDLLVMETHLAGMTATSWIDDKGLVVREETASGWAIVAESRESVQGRLEASAFAAVDIIEQVSVPVTGKLPRPRSVRSLTLKVSGFDTAEIPYREPRQVLLDRDRGVIRITAHNESSIDGTLLPFDDEGLQAYLEPSLWIDSDDPAIRAMARNIVGNEKDSWSAARLISDWVYRNIEKIPSPDIPIATEVLKHLRGDCNEHTSLFVALARAAGIPADMSAGLVYLDGAFYYHAWPRVFVGTWVDMDPTFGGNVADATHLELVAGDFAAQARIAMTMGRIGLEIIDFEEM